MRFCPVLSASRESCSRGTAHHHSSKQSFVATQSDQGCSFILNPPASSYMGCVRERQIRTVRSVLTSIMDQSARRPGSTSLRTFLNRVMAIVNSLPLTTEHLNDPIGQEPLTPNHILKMKSSINAPPPGDFMREDLYLQKRWKRVQFLSNEFWTRRRNEYLLNLQVRSKWSKDRRNAKVNDIVLLQDDGMPWNQWKLAKVFEVFQGADEKVRKLKLLVSDPTLDRKDRRTFKPVYFERPIHKTVRLLEAEFFFLYFCFLYLKSSCFFCFFAHMS